MASRSLTIAPPDGSKEPRKVNVFEFARFANTTLSTLFPYVDSGDIAPALTKIHGGRDGGYSYFEHRNTVDEVIMCIAGEGGYLRTGEITAGPREHGVSSFLVDETDPDAYGLFVVTQRQEPTEAEQSESYIMRCQNCEHELFRFDYEGREPQADGADNVFMTPYSCGVGAQKFNASLELRTCDNCGTVNPPFPDDTWGWRDYRADVDLSRKARAAFVEAGSKTKSRSRRKGN